jgi:hypothetical protein
LDKCDTPECDYWCEECGYCEHGSHYHCSHCNGITGMMGHYAGAIWWKGQSHDLPEGVPPRSCDPAYEEALERIKSGEEG